MSRTPKSKRGWRSGFGTLAVLALVQLVSYQNCGSDFVVKDGIHFASSASVCEQSLEADFQSSYYPFLKSNCATCHTARGPGNGAFADSNADVAFPAFLITTTAMIDLNATNTAHSGNSGPQHTSAITLAGQQWAAAEASCKSGDGGPTSTAWMTSEKVMGATATAKDLVWNLDSELSQALNSGGATLTIAVREQASPNGTPVYYFTNPRLKAGTKSVSLEGVMISINGQNQILGTTWSRVSVTADAGKTVTLSAAQMFIEYPAFSASDTLSVTIDSLSAQ